MATPTAKRISELDAAGPLTGAEILAFDQNNRTVKGTIDTIKTFTDTSCQCTLVSRYDAVGCGTSGGTEFLQTYTMPGGTIATDGSWLHIYASGYFGTESSNKYIGIAVKRYDSTVVNIGYTATSSAVLTDVYWNFEYILTRSASDTMTALKKITYVDAWGGAGAYNAPLQMIQTYHTSSYSNLWANDIIFQIYGSNTSGVANDTIVDQFIITVNKIDTNS